MQTRKKGIIKILSLDGYGFIEYDVNSRDIYFKSSDLMNGKFEYLKLGDKVDYLEVGTAKGVNAKYVVLSNRPYNNNKIKYL